MKTIKRIIGKGCPVCLAHTISIWDSEHKLWKCNNCGQLYETVMHKASKPLKEMEIPK